MKPNRYPDPVPLSLGFVACIVGIAVIADYANLHTLRMWGGLLNEVAILLFIGMTVYSVCKSLRAKA